MQMPGPSRGSIWAGRILSGLVVLFLLLDAVIHLANPAPVIEASKRLGIPLNRSLAIGILELVCIAVYLIPRTAVVGAVLLTGYLGGAIAIHMRAGSSFFEMVVFPVLVAAMVWGGLLLRDRRARALVGPQSCSVGTR